MAGKTQRSHRRVEPLTAGSATCAAIEADVVQEINANNMDTEILSQMWSNYTRNVLFNLEDTNSLQKPV
jgi:DASH complex subunit Dad4